MRTLDPILQTAMDSGNFTPIVRAAYLDPVTHAVDHYLDLVYYKISGLDIEIKFYDPTGAFPDSVSLERGALIGGVEYTIFSGIYYLNKSYKVEGGKYGLCTATGSLIKNISADIIADLDYWGTIDLFCDLLGIDPDSVTDAAWHTYWFMWIGDRFKTTNALTFFPLLKQKYLVNAEDNGINQLLFFAASEILALDSYYTLTLSARDVFSVGSIYRQFIWIDEVKTLHQSGDTSFPIHNLGYLETGCDPPDIPDNALAIRDTCMVAVPNLKYQTGDCVMFDPVIVGYTPVKSVLEVTEIFDSNSKDLPAWRMELRPLRYFSDAEGGYSITTDLSLNTYYPLSTSGFSGYLKSNITNLSSLAKAVDEILSSLNVFIETQMIKVATANKDALVLQTTDDETDHKLLEARSSYDSVVAFLTATGRMGLGIDTFAFAGAVFEMLTAAATVMALRGTYTSSTFKLRNEHDQGTPAYVNPMLTFSVVYTEGARGYATIDFGDEVAHGNICFVISGSTGQVGIGTLNADMAAKLHVTSTSTGQVTVIAQAKASQTVDIQQWKNALNVLVKINKDGVFFPVQAPTASAPTYVKGGMYFDTTLNKLRIGGATAWETVTSI
jgi:hypothetical protein